ncbi:ABC transporter ATP-binding protein [Paracoccus binzhouensis]|uniref:ABC transporter ATP-binding protein n=1 Tax=Paracoccus binzhouensis TaxID=2796149 RepID=UPI0018EEECB0|nr:ATP-binding cassette domain-containing protein [Paracoccus binzhouensis]
MIRVRDLSLHHGARPILRHVTLEVAQGETLALIGPSGSGKTTLARMLLGLPPQGRAMRWRGRVTLDGLDMLESPARRLRRFRAAETGMIVQALSDALNPHLSVAQHLCEAGDPQALAEGFNIPPRLLPRLPRDLSGGEIQRVLTALAMAKAPRVLILDEPTAALDPENRAWATARFAAGARDRAQLLITHDLELARALSDRIAVMRAGELVEIGAAAQVLARPGHACTRRLLGFDRKPGLHLPPAEPRDGGLLVEGLRHRIGDRLLLREVSARIPVGHGLAVVGPSGCGKSTLARLLAGYLPLQQGRILWQPGGRAPRVALVSQHPHRALARHFTVEQVLAEALRLARQPDDPARIAALLRDTGLPDAPGFRARRTDTLSGGEAQRLVIARAVAVHPDCLVADEPTSALDPVSRDQVLGLLNRLKRERGVALLLVTHDGQVARALAERTARLQDGRLVFG